MLSLLARGRFSQKRVFFVLSSGLLLIAPFAARGQNAMPAPDAAAKVVPQSPAWSEPLDGAPAALHVLNRLAFGPRPGDVEDVQRLGIRAWIEAQLNPSAIDDSAVETRLASLELLKADPGRLMLIYEGDNGALRRFQKMQGQGQGKRFGKGKFKGIVLPENAAPAPVAAQKQKKNGELNPRQLQILADFQAAGLKPGVSTQTAAQLVENKLVRAVESKRQLQEVLVDFWSNHFNIDMRKNAGRVLKVVDDREAIRPHIFGSFRELLGASAHSPAMLLYLDNARSSKAITGRMGQTRGGLNENYGRELMELHTLGVDGGYTQNDVTEVARCFTGWGIARESGTFQFHPRLHDDGDKVVLGQHIGAGGERDGEQVLDMLAASPSTARFLSHELCQRFVADEPPPALVERVAQTFLQSKGDLPSVYRAIFLSKEFLSKGAYRAKIKSPFEYTVSSVRALGGQLSIPDASNPDEARRLMQIGAASSQQNARGGMGRGGRIPLAVQIATLGQPVFACLPPTGWSEDSRSWVSAGAIVGRLNFALSLTSGQVGDVRLASDTFRPASLDALSQELVGGQLSAATRSTIAKETAQSPDPAKTRALILGSPEFQRR